MIEVTNYVTIDEVIDRTNPALAVARFDVKIGGLVITGCRVVRLADGAFTIWGPSREVFFQTRLRKTVLAAIRGRDPQTDGIGQGRALVLETPKRPR